MFQRAVVGVTALIFAIATFDVGRAFAQAVIVDGGTGTTTSTACGMGTREECGFQDIMTCSWKFELDIGAITRTGGLRIGKYECQKTGRRTLYKDVNGTLLGTGGDCGTTVGGGSRGGGLSGTRGSGDDAGDEYGSCSL